MNPQVGRVAWETVKTLAKNKQVRRGVTVVAGPIVKHGLEQGWKATSRGIRNRNPIVAVTGLPGAGKTVLSKQLRSSKRDYTPLSSGSPVMEKVLLRKGLRSVRFRVVPGEVVPARRKALEELFHDKPVDGVIHVVANGYATPRSVAGRAEDPGTSLAQYRELQLAREVDDFHAMRQEISSLVAKSSRPMWLLIAVAKTDLYETELDDVISYYTSSPNSPFVQQLNTLLSEVGSDNLKVAVMPFYSIIEDFKWNGHKINTNGTVEQRDKYLDSLVERTRQLVGHVS